MGDAPPKATKAGCRQIFNPLDDTISKFGPPVTNYVKPRDTDIDSLVRHAFAVHKEADMSRSLKRAGFGLRTKC